MSTIQHKAVTGADLHGIVAFSVASTSSRNALSVVAGDIGKVCQVTADNSFYVLTSVSPAVWSPFTPAPTLAVVATSGAYADLSGTPTLATVAVTGSYVDLTNKPTIPAAATWSTLSGAPSLATVATSGSYVDLSGAPTLATVATSGSYADLTNKPTIPAAANWDTLPGAPTLSVVATTGSYADLTNKPTIPTVPTWHTLSDAPTLATVATTGSYADLTNKPDAPTEYILPVASVAVLGGVKAGSGVAIDGSGTISVAVDTYTLPVASTSILGGIKIGAGLSMDETGIVTAPPSVSLTTPNTWLAAQRGAVVALTVDAAIALDFTASNNFSLTLTQSFTLANPINVVAGQSGVIAVTQPGAGNCTISWGTHFKAAGGTKPVLTATPGAVDYISYYVESVTRIFVSIAADVK